MGPRLLSEDNLQAHELPTQSRPMLAASLDPTQHPTPDTTDRTFLTSGPRKGLALGLGTQGPDPQAENALAKGCAKGSPKHPAQRRHNDDPLPHSSSHSLVRMS